MGNSTQENDSRETLDGDETENVDSYYEDFDFEGKFYGYTSISAIICLHFLLSLTTVCWVGCKLAITSFLVHTKYKIIESGQENRESCTRFRTNW